MADGVRRWGWVVGTGLGAVTSAGVALASGFFGVLIGSDEAMAAQPFYAGLLIGLLVSAGLLVACGIALIRALR